MRRYTRELARALNVIGLMNIQFAISNQTVYVLEVNPRASRTVPFVSKATGVPIYLCPGRGRNAFASSNGSNPNWFGPYTDYRITYGAFGNNSNPAGSNGPNGAKITLPAVSNQNGTSNSIYVAEGYLQTTQYQRTATSGWEEDIFSGGYGGTGRWCASGSVTGNNCVIDLRQDNAVDGNSNRWGGPHPVWMVAFCDGSVRTVNYNQAGLNTAAARALDYRNTRPINLDN
jgi:hypothetical protein